MAFSILHEPWSVPLIFVLSLMLGYLYERTGTLWAPIAVHFVFNAVNVLFVLMRL
jgi:membrane protease YdiL (CAAX protease family)